MGAGGDRAGAAGTICVSAGENRSPQSGGTYASGTASVQKDTQARCSRKRKRPQVRPSHAPSAHVRAPRRTPAPRPGYGLPQETRCGRSPAAARVATLENLTRRPARGHLQTKGSYPEPAPPASARGSRPSPPRGLSARLAASSRRRRLRERAGHGRCGRGMTREGAGGGGATAGWWAGLWRGRGQGVPLEGPDDCTGHSQLRGRGLVPGGASLTSVKGGAAGTLNEPDKIVGGAIAARSALWEAWSWLGGGADADFTL